MLSGLGPEELGEDEVRAQSPSRAHPRRPDVPFRASRPGTWIAASVSKEHGTPREERLTCVSLYGLMDELGDASMHRSLSDVSAAFSDPTYRDLVILGGDFNIGTSLEGAELRERSRVVLDRIRAYDLRDCLAAWREKENLPRLAQCPCGDNPCRHTLTRLIPRIAGDTTPWQERTPYQVDYLFASNPLADRLEGVIETSPDEWERYSDHAPLIVRFRKST